MKQLIETRLEELSTLETHIQEISNDLKKATLQKDRTYRVNIPVSVLGTLLIVNRGRIIVHDILEGGVKSLFFESQLISVPISFATLALGTAMIVGDEVVIKISQQRKKEWAKKLEESQLRLDTVKEDLKRLKTNLEEQQPPPVGRWQERYVSP